MSFFENLKSVTGRPIALNFMSSAFKVASKNTAGKKQETKANEEDKYNEIDIKEDSVDKKQKSNSKSEYNQEELEKSGAKADRSKGTREMHIIGTYYVDVPTDSRWKEHPLEEKEVEESIKEYIPTAGYLWATGGLDENGNELPASYQEKTKYTDGTTKVDVYDYGKLTESTTVRYSGDPNNPQEGDQKRVEIKKYNEDGSYTVTTETTTWVDSEGIGPGWYDDLVYRPINTRVFDRYGEEISSGDSTRKNERNSILRDSMFGYARTEKNPDGSYKPYENIEYKE